MARHLSGLPGSVNASGCGVANTVRARESAQSDTSLSEGLLEEVFMIVAGAKI